ncbi:halocyanin domain-containing protein [Haloarcula salinisoli]|uniref:Halocyanin domain-containing protein n=1 Tax=Haloarcula salinisoli TaxID=2487746 RepID=A0A8J7YJF8_9EURY|nr:halocyanin domain-containing protein [Halomicroarcula salinisoli]MBX0285555.1 halocyanin domain-containing protein [Halomicroarcula salinisoli]MBX0302961.1 halocyanin domain-containing protein [Halomicroarcula salinisoli]
MTANPDRRAFLGITAATAAGLLAGCSSSDGGVPSETGSPQQTVDQYLNETDNYDGTIQDETGSDSVTVDVGAEGNGGAYAFAPPAVRIDSGTTVTWVWTGNGSGHNVVHEQGEFESETTAEADNEFEHTFESTGTYLYYCAPHLGFNMRGAVVVE